MESNSSKIEQIILEIILLLEYGEEEYWLSYFKHILQQIKSKSTSYEAIKSLSMIFKGGMGSFSDLVLHKNGAPLIEENNKLDNLKDNLYELCEEILRKN